MHVKFGTALLILFLVGASASAEIVSVQNRGLIDLSGFVCTDVSKSYIRRVCYDSTHRYMLVDLNGLWHDYCGITKVKVRKLLAAESVARYFSAHVRRQYNCPPHPAMN